MIQSLRFWSACILILLLSKLGAQGTVRGKITDENGETVIGAAVFLQDNKTVGTITDLDGNFSLNVKDNLPHTLTITFVSYTNIEEKIQLKDGQVLVKNFTLKPKDNVIGQVEITTSAVKNKDYYLENIKKKSTTSIDYISSETMKKTGDNNVTAAVARVSGVSTNGSFITVRGIGDRYLKTNINGMRIPTLDPFTNNIKLDLFPASLVDNIIITKTASPDLPGDWAGAYLSVETKDYPEQLTISFENAFTFNPQSTGVDILSTEKSSTDWLGYDGGLRDVNHSNFTAFDANITPYEEFEAIGLGGYFNSLGVNGSSQWNETYFKLGLVQLGLLAPANFDNAEAFSQARDAYNAGSYKLDAYRKINAGAAESGGRFANNWQNKTETGPVNFSQSFSIGNQVNLFGRPLGFFVGYLYSNNVLNDNNAIAQRAGIDNNGNVFIVNDIQQQASRLSNGWSGLLNLAYKPSPNHSIALLFMPNQNGENNVRFDSEVDQSFTTQEIYTQTQFYEQRRQMVYQVKTDHFFPKLKLKADVNASYTRGRSIAPDFKSFDYFLNIDDSLEIDQTASRTSRFYRYLSEDLLDTKVAFELPIAKQRPGLTRKVRFGGAYQYLTRDYDQYNYLLKFTKPNKFIIQNNDVSPFFDLANFGFNEQGLISAYYERDENPGNSSIGYSTITAGFAMVDFNINPQLRIAGGLRVEHADMYTDVRLYDSLGYAANDGRRFFTEGIIALAPNPGALNELSLLPSVNVVYKLRDDEVAPINLRANFSETVARPSLRELSEIIVFDYELRVPVFGRSDLKMVNIRNYDLRLENYFKSGDNVSFSLFYKDFKNHIELTNSNFGFSWQNVDKSRAMGIELEGRKKIIKNLEFRANVTFTESRTEFTQTIMQLDNGVKTYLPIEDVSRPMFGQAPYVLNGILNYTSDTLRFSATVSYNRQGKRLVITNGLGIPDVYEVPRDMIDIKLSKNLWKHWVVSFTVRDVLNTAIRRTYNFTDGTRIDFDSFRFGTFYQFAVQYRL
ncbi:MAG: carboxypeptidase-like regulatory domain-containing protein [Bacteroidia bacterium]